MVELTTEYKDTSCEIGQWLTIVFGLNFLKPSDVVDCFVEDPMSDDPSNTRCISLADYVLENYIVIDAKFHPNIW